MPISASQTLGYVTSSLSGLPVLPQHYSLCSWIVKVSPNSSTNHFPHSCCWSLWNTYWSDRVAWGKPCSGCSAFRELSLDLPDHLLYDLCAWVASLYSRVSCGVHTALHVAIFLATVLFLMFFLLKSFPSSPLPSPDELLAILEGSGQWSPPRGRPPFILPLHIITAPPSYLLCATLECLFLYLFAYVILSSPRDSELIESWNCLIFLCISRSEWLITI